MRVLMGVDLCASDWGDALLPNQCYRAGPAMSTTILEARNGLQMGQGAEFF
ncbi:MAG: hypothetical protein JO069_22950 [Verrucomicrobia bacterium]|nr:hypothetical protein [Verrucomicrobiota bacterium]